jgi:hypothetical protein
MSECSDVERWRPIPGWAGYYEASDLGRIRSVDRVITYRGSRIKVAHKGRILATKSGPKGHRCVTLSLNNADYYYTVHRLVLLTFVGPPPDGFQGCHNNGIPTDNRLTNLRWDTQSENMRDVIRHGRDPQRNRTRCPRDHPLVHPNLVACIAADGRRECLACSRTRAARQRATRCGRLFDFKLEADKAYARIMRGVAA